MNMAVPVNFFHLDLAVGGAFFGAGAGGGAGCVGAGVGEVTFSPPDSTELLLAMLLECEWPPAASFPRYQRYNLVANMGTKRTE